MRPARVFEEKSGRAEEDKRGEERGQSVCFFEKKDEKMIDNESFIREMKHFRGIWNQYDVLMAMGGYGWKTMVDWAAYMESADLDDVSTLTVTEAIDIPETELIDDYRRSGKDLREFDKLSVEKGLLAIGGISRTLKVPVKIVWFNQTAVLRIFTPIDDERLLTAYVETAIGRTFHTKDAMKSARSV